MSTFNKTDMGNLSHKTEIISNAIGTRIADGGLSRFSQGCQYEKTPALIEYIDNMTDYGAKRIDIKLEKNKITLRAIEKDLYYKDFNEFLTKFTTISKDHESKHIEGGVGKYGFGHNAGGAHLMSKKKGYIKTRVRTGDGILYGYCRHFDYTGPKWTDSLLTRVYDDIDFPKEYNFEIVMHSYTDDFDMSNKDILMELERRYAIPISKGLIITFTGKNKHTAKPNVYDCLYEDIFRGKKGVDVNGNEVDIIREDYIKFGDNYKAAKLTWMNTNIALQITPEYSPTSEWWLENMKNVDAELTTTVKHICPFRREKCNKIYLRINGVVVGPADISSLISCQKHVNSVGFRGYLDIYDETLQNCIVGGNKSKNVISYEEVSEEIEKEFKEQITKIYRSIDSEAPKLEEERIFDEKCNVDEFRKYFKMLPNLNINFVKGKNPASELDSSRLDDGEFDINTKSYMFRNYTQRAIMDFIFTAIKADKHTFKIPKLESLNSVDLAYEVFDLVESQIELIKEFNKPKKR